MDTRVLHLRATPLPFGTEPVELWVVDGRITFEPRRADAELAAPGGFVSPGLVDAHCHLFFSNDRVPRRPPHRVIPETLGLHARAGTLLVRDLGSTTDEVLRMPPRDDQPGVQSSGPCLLIESTFPFQVTRPEDLATAMASQARAGAPWIKVFADWPGWNGKTEEPPFGDDPATYAPEVLRDAVRAAHEGGARVAAHAFGRAGAQAAVFAGVDSIEHGWGLDDALVDEMATRGIAWTPMLAIAPPMLRGAEATSNDTQATWIRASVESLRTLIPRAHRAGVPVLAGTDWFPAVTLAQEVAALHASGLAPADALACASTVGRAFLRARGLEEGAPADLVLFRSDPREGLGALENPELVLLGGRAIQRWAR